MGDTAPLQSTQQQIGEPEPIILRKGKRVWRFVWSPPDVPVLIQTLADFAEDPLIDLDRFDAALVVYELGRRLQTISPRPCADHLRSEAPS